MIVDLHLQGQLVIIVGAGSQGLKRINSLLAQDCKILVFDQKINSQIKKHVEKKNIKFKKMKITNADFLLKYKPHIVVASTNNAKLNRQILKQAKAINSFAYASDDPKFSDFAYPSMINIKDTLQIAISTKGQSPIMASKIKQLAKNFFNKSIKNEDILQIKLQGSMRDEAKKRISSHHERKEYMYSLFSDMQIKQLIKDNKLKMAQRRAMILLKDWQ